MGVFNVTTLITVAEVFITVLEKRYPTPTTTLFDSTFTQKTKVTVTTLRSRVFRILDVNGGTPFYPQQ